MRNGRIGIAAKSHAYRIMFTHVHTLAANKAQDTVDSGFKSTYGQMVLDGAGNMEHLKVHTGGRIWNTSTCC